MTTPLLRKLFKEIRILETKNLHLASITRKNLRSYVDQYKTADPLKKKKLINNQSMADLSSFIELLSVANRQSQQFSQNQRIKLFEMSYNINSFVNNSYRFSDERVSRQIQAVYQCEQYKQLRSESERQFVINIMKKVYQGEQNFQYPHLSDFFLDKRFKKSVLSSRDHQAMLDRQASQQVSRILTGQLKVNSNYRQLYEYYFTEASSRQIAFTNYLDSLFILRDFDDTQEDWETNTRQRQHTRERNAQNTKMERQRKQQVKQKSKQLKKKVEEQLNLTQHQKQHDKIGKRFNHSTYNKNRQKKY